MKVLKFGGTSVGTPESLRNVIQVVEAIDEPMVVVVSALGGITDLLISTADMAMKGNDAYHEQFSQIVRRHYDVIEALAPEGKEQHIKGIVDEMLQELNRLFQGVELIGQLPRKALNTIVSFGERMSSRMIAHFIKGAYHVNSLDLIKTERWFGKDIADTELTTANIRKGFATLEAGKPAIVGGFISTDEATGHITNLGRGGSDFTAALIAASLGADILEIWTDVDGFMTADPRIIPEAYVIDRMSYVESMELCSFGAKVIYPPTIYPVFHKNIPIVIKNTFNPSAPGTFISDITCNTGCRVCGVSFIPHSVLISICGHSPASSIEVNSRLFNRLAKNGVGVILVSRMDDVGCTSFAVAPQDAGKALKLLQEEFAVELQSGQLKEIKSRDDLGVIAVVGENIRNIKHLPGRIANTLARKQISVEALSYGNSDTNIAMMVETGKLREALILIHQLVFTPVLHNT